MKPLWIAIVLTIAALGLFLMPAFVGNHQQQVVMLERLAPKIERAQALAPEARDAIQQLVERVRNAPADQNLESRRALAIDRVAAALKEKDSAHELSSVGVGRRDD